jgi:monothiol glutaredoxin
MTRAILSDEKIHPAARDKISANHADIVREVEAAIGTHAVVIVGMKQNPHPRRARRLLDEQKIAYHYLEYGSYLGPWRRRTALKMWSGWPTFPMVFVNGTLIGGANELSKLLESGELRRLLGEKQA